MIITTLIPLAQAQQYSAQQVGKKSITLAKLLEKKLPFPAGFIIPKETFKNIAHHNGLVSTAELIFETADWSNELSAQKNLTKIKLLIEKQIIPQDIAQQITQAYQKLVGKDFVKISSQHGLIENIKGETNLIESVLKLWAKNIKKDKLFPAPQIILAQIQPDASGMIDFTSKHTLTIQSTWGVFTTVLNYQYSHDVFTIDSGTLNITSRHLNPKTNHLKRSLDKLEKTKAKKPLKASLTDGQIAKLAQLAIATNRQFIGNKKIFFEIKNKKIIFSDLEDQTILQPQESLAEAILIGQSITGGYIENYPEIATTFTQKQNFSTGRILVTKKLTYQDLALIKQASAIICEEKTIDRSILAAVKEHFIPCVIGVDFALSTLNKKQKIVVDAAKGKIFLASQIGSIPTTQNTYPQLTSKIYLSAGNPYQAETYPIDSDGIFLKSDYGIAFWGLHPQHLLKTKKDLFTQNLLRLSQTFLERQPHNFFYRSCNLNSNELLSLKFSENYEKLEPNPYLGTRGGLKIIQDPALFTLELKTIWQLAEKTKKEINFVIPFVRTATELAIVFKKIDKIIPHTNHLKFWLQLNTPATVFNLKEFLHLPLAGITFQAQTIHDLSYGLDPDNPDLHENYTLDTNLITGLLDICAKTLTSHLPSKASSADSLPLILKLNNFNAQVVSAAARLGVRAIVVKPSLFDIVKQQIVDTEEKLILKK